MIDNKYVLMHLQKEYTAGVFQNGRIKKGKRLAFPQDAGLFQFDISFAQSM